MRSGDDRTIDPFDPSAASAVMRVTRKGLQHHVPSLTPALSAAPGGPSLPRRSDVTRMAPADWGSSVTPRPKGAAPSSARTKSVNNTLLAVASVRSRLALAGIAIEKVSTEARSCPCAGGVPPPREHGPSPLSFSSSLEGILYLESKGGGLGEGGRRSKEAPGNGPTGFCLIHALSSPPPTLPQKE